MNRVALWRKPVVNTRVSRYRINTQRENTQRTREKKNREPSPWLIFAIVLALSSMICLTVNLRASSELSEESKRHQILSDRVDRLLEENEKLREEIRRLQTDTTIIEREARKLGMGLPNEKVLVSAN